MTFTRKRLIFIGIAILVLIAVIYGFWPDAVSVQMETAERGPMQVVVEEEGQTAVTDRYEVRAPVSAMLQRVDLEAGDVVEEGQPLVRLLPPPSPILDRRSRAEAQARLEGAEASIRGAERQVDAAEAAYDRAREHRERTERLYEQDSATQQDVEQARSEESQARARLESARASVAQAEADRISAQAALQTGLMTDQTAGVTIEAPASGRILAVHRESEGMVNPEEPLLDIGDTEMLEIHVDVLSQDAFQIEPGTRVILDQWGGDQELEARVDRIEPEALTDISALGVEEQRVGVRASLDSPSSEWEGLGAGYRVLARFIVWEDDDVLTVPTSALFRTENGWALFAVESGRAAYRDVEIRQQSGLLAYVTSGLEEGEEVIVHPGNDVEDGVRVQRRE